MIDDEDIIIEDVTEAPNTVESGTNFKICVAMVILAFPLFYIIYTIINKTR